MATPSAVRLVFGAGGIGEGAITHTWTTGEQTSELLDVLKELELTELDSAASAPPGSPRVSERLLGESRAAGKEFVIDTKIERTAISGGLSEAAIDSSLEKSLELLGVKQVNILYAHFPDPNTPVEESARAFDKHYRAGLFKELGLCNHSLEQMREWLQVCEKHNYVKPTVWQGHYNAIRRAPEAELFPFLKQHNIRIYAYSPLAGGFLTGKVSLATEAETLSGGRWDPSRLPFYVKAFDKPVIHTAMIAFCKKCDAAGVTPTEVSLRWIVHHSALGEGDAIILGASRFDQLRGNVEFCKKGRLDEGLLGAYEELWKGVEKDPPEWF